jgi:hypothetical protein
MQHVNSRLLNGRQEVKLWSHVDTVTLFDRGEYSLNVVIRHNKIFFQTALQYTFKTGFLAELTKLVFLQYNFLVVRINLQFTILFPFL